MGRGRNMPADIGTDPSEGGDGLTRRCLVTGDRRPRDRLIRFVLDPDGRVTPDLAETLPGRGMWLSADAGTIKTACHRRLFAKAVRGRAEAPDDLAQQVEALLTRRVVDLVSLARRAGEAVAGFEKVASALRSGRVKVLLAASDAAADGRAKIAALAAKTGAGQIAMFECLRADEIGRAFGRDAAVHVAVAPGGLAVKLMRDAARLAALRSGDA